MRGRGMTLDELLPPASAPTAAAAASPASDAAESPPQSDAEAGCVASRVNDAEAACAAGPQDDAMAMAADLAATTIQLSARGVPVDLRLRSRLLSPRGER
eukprot:1688406-Prymnesium_polylepis.1